MSLIERALGKARKEVPQASASATSATTIRRRALRMVERKVENPSLILTDQMRQQLGLLVPSEQRRQRTAEYRHIKRQVIAQIRADNANRVVVVASALSGDGKSYVSSNLGFSFALEPDYTVLLVDGDVLKPHLTSALGLLDRRGLMDAVADRSTDVESLVLTTDVEGLSVLPAGSASDFATELFSSERMSEVLEHLLAVPNRIVLIDSPPLLLTTEARALAPLAGQLLLVVRAESTPQAAVRQALDLIGDTSRVKLVLDDVVRTALARYMGEGYGYDYGYGDKN